MKPRRSARCDPLVRQEKELGRDPLRRRAVPQPLPPVLRNVLVRLGLAPAGVEIRGEPLTGGVSSEVWRADLPSGPVCVKRAVERLRVTEIWTAPTIRTAFEAAWLEAAHAMQPGATCRPLGFDAKEGVLALEWLDPHTHPTWKGLLSAGRIAPEVGADLGRRLARWHTGMADAGQFADRFDTADLFDALRITPYLQCTADRHPEHRKAFDLLIARTSSTGRTVIHGDVSPKNVLVGTAGPMLIDAECATWGDPAFDLAFCANHLLLKAVWLPRFAPALRAVFDTFTSTYLSEVGWELASQVALRSAQLLPALSLARVDGASPVEYLDDQKRATVRRLTDPLLRGLPNRLDEVADHWFAGLPLPRAAEVTSL